MATGGTASMAVRLRGAMRALWPALRVRLLGRGLLTITGLAFILSYSLTTALAWLLPPSGPLQAHTALVASVAVDLFSLAVLIGLLPGRRQDRSPWAALTAWAESLIVAAAALAGIACAPFHHESARTFAILWLLFVGQAALVTAGYALVRFLLPPAFSRLLVLTLLSISATALFWSKPVIERLPKAARADMGGSLEPAQLVMSLSVPAAVASAWYQNSDAARAQAEGRYGLIHGPLTYSVWLGSYQAIAYPRILPSRDDAGRLDFGLAAKLLICSLPVLVLCELVQSARADE